jgi:hypothetical protein
MIAASAPATTAGCIALPVSPLMMVARIAWSFAVKPNVSRAVAFIA